MHPRPSALSRLLLGLASVLLLAGCASADATPPGAAGGLAEEECAELSSLATPADGPQPLLIIDRTASTSMHELPAPVIAQLNAAADSPREEGQAAATVYQVGGSGAEAVVNGWPLTFPQAGDARAERLAEMSVACLQQRLHSVTPETPGSDILSSLAVAARHPRAQQITLVTDGLANAGPLDLRQVVIGETDPQTIATDLATLGALPDLTGRRVLIAGLGVTRDGLLPLPVQAWLDEVYEAICQRTGAHCELSVEAAATEPPAEGLALPEDLPVPLPEVTVVRDDQEQTTTYTLSSTLLFLPNSSELRQPLPSEFEQIAQALAADPTLFARVEGHTATWGTPEGRDALSRQRADVVAEALVDLGAPADRISTIGYGATQPVAVDLLPDGSWDESAAVKNRRVEITLVRSE